MFSKTLIVLTIALALVTVGWLIVQPNVGATRITATHVSPISWNDFVDRRMGNPIAADTDWNAIVDRRMGNPIAAVTDWNAFVDRRQGNPEIRTSGCGLSREQNDC